MMQRLASLIINHKIIIGCVLALLVIAIILIFTFRTPPQTPIIVSEGVEFELRGVGRIPNITTVMNNNSNLRKRVETFCARDEAYVFGQVSAVDKEVVEILLIWSGVNIDAAVTQKTREGLHPHIDHFVRAAYNMSDVMPIKKNPLVGDDPWLRLFTRYKARLIAQCAAGQKVYNGPILYDIELDRISVNGPVSEDFINGFNAFLQTKEDRQRYANNLLAFINDTKGLKNLSSTERELIEVLR